MIMKLTTLTSTDEAMTTFGSLMLQETPKLSVIKIDAHFSHLSFSKKYTAIPPYFCVYFCMRYLCCH